MKAYLNSITGIDDAIISMYMSKRSWTREKENNIRAIVSYCTTRYGDRLHQNDQYMTEFDDMVSKVLKWGQKHYTMLRFIDLSITVEGLHRGAQDDFDSHAMRMSNRIIRSSTRLAEFSDREISDYYKDKIIPTDEALSMLDIQTPNRIIKDGQTYVKSSNGYILETMKDNKDVKRGLYMLSIPSNFICKICLTEFAHILKERDKNSHANPELQECVESILTQISGMYPTITREYLYGIRN